MAALSNHVSLNITADSVGVARAGFGTPLLLSANASWSDGLVRSYESLSDVAVDFVSGTPEYRAASAMFSQSPRVTKVKIGKSPTKPTQVYQISVSAVRNSYTYSINVVGPSFSGTASYTSDASATDAEIAAGLVSALNGIASNNYTASGSASPITITADAAGTWFSLEVTNVSDLEIAQTHADPGVATDLAAIALADNDWYALYTLYNSNAYALAAAAWVEANKKFYMLDVNESDAITTAAGNSDTLDDIATLTYARTAGMYHPDPSEMAGAAWLGNCLPREPGSETWKFKKLAGISAVSMTATHRSNLVSRNGNSYETVAGVNITFNGTTADGDFIDTQRNLDWLEDDVSKTVFETLAGAAKIPFTDSGVALIKGAISSSLARAVRKGILANDPEPEVTAPLVANVSAGDKALRLLPDVKFSGTLEGAIHKVTINGVVSV